MPKANTSTMSEEQKNSHYATNNIALQRAIQSALNRGLLANGEVSFDTARKISIASGSYFRNEIGELDDAECEKKVKACFDYTSTKPAKPCW